MYELLIDCGTFRVWHTFESLEDYKSFMSEVDQEKQGFSDKLLDTGILNFGIDCYELSKVFPTYNISVGSVLKNRDTEALEAVRSISVDEYDGVEISTNVVTGITDELEFDEWHCSIYSVEGVYKGFDLVGEDFKLFEGVGNEGA